MHASLPLLTNRSVNKISRQLPLVKEEWLISYLIIRLLCFLSCGSFEEAETRIAAWIEEDYNRLYVHSALGYLSPEEFAQQWVQTQEATSQGAQI